MLIIISYWQYLLPFNITCLWKVCKFHFYQLKIRTTVNDEYNPTDYYFKSQGKFSSTPSAINNKIITFQ